MGKKHIFIIILLVIAVIVMLLLYMSQGLQRKFKQEAEKGISATLTDEVGILTNQDIQKLPKIVQKYVISTGAIGKERVKNLKTISEIDMNLGEGKGWTKMTAIEYNFFGGNPLRMVLMKFKMKGIPVIGMDSFIDGKGGMVMKPFGLISIVNEKDTKMDDTSAAVMLLLNMCAAAPSTLIDDRIQWSVIEPLLVKATFNAGSCTVSALLEFKGNGELIKFSTEDKFYNPNGSDYKKIKWSTPIMRYKSINGFHLSTYGEATWHFPEGKSCYGKSNLKKLEYNITDYSER